MESPRHTLAHLFCQLGLPDGETAIDAFIGQHRPLPNGVALHEAPFWDAAQATFLREEIIDDADWAPVIDALNAMLR